MLNVTGLTKKVRALLPRPSHPMARFKRLLSESGYYIFTVHTNQRRHRANMIIIHMDEPTFALWIYERDGERVVRPWSHTLPYHKLVGRLSRISPGEDFKLVLGGLMKMRRQEPYSWTDWLSDASKRRLWELGFVPETETARDP